MKSLCFVFLVLSVSAYAHDDGVAELPETDAPLETKEPSITQKASQTPQTTVTAHRPARSGSQLTVKKEDYELVPRRSAANLLEVAPGLITVQTAGGGKANQYFLRGFDLDHGTDLALGVDGVPVNMPTHAHGQGYADLNFVIPELVERVEVTKGPYAARDGDFATAGAINLVTADHVHQNRATFSAGNFGFLRGLLLVAPEPGPMLDGYLGAEAVLQNGAYERGEHVRRYNVNARAALRPRPSIELSLQLQSTMSGWDAAGALPLRLIESGELSRFGTLSPTDGGNTFRHAANLAFRANDVAAGRLSANLYGIRYGLDLFSNFSFYAADPVNGDQLRQSDLRTVTGGAVQYQRPFALGPVSLGLSTGLQARSDVIDVALAHVRAREPLEDLTRDRVAQQAFAVYAEADVGITRWLRTVVGARVDGFHYALAGQQLGAGLFSPKAALIITPHESFSFFGNAGRGFHSNDARALQPPTAATAYELGARFHPSRFLDVGLVAWGLHLDSELVWVGDEGHTEPSGPSRRRGLELDVRTRPVSWFSAEAAATLTDARFVNGDFVPLAPVWTLSAGINVHHPSGAFGALKWTQVGSRPANEDGSIQAKPIALLDAQVGYTLKNFTLAIEGLNLLNSTWYEGQFVSRSRAPSETDAVEGLQVTPGLPITVRASLTVTLD